MYNLSDTSRPRLTIVNPPVCVVLLCMECCVTVILQLLRIICWEIYELFLFLWTSLQTTIDYKSFQCLVLFNIQQRARKDYGLFLKKFMVLNMCVEVKILLVDDTQRELLDNITWLVIFMPPDWLIGGILFISCLFVCLFVCLLSTLTFAITFELLEVETSYLAIILH